MLWGICCYFNPCGYRTKLVNYQAFQQHLNVPLLTVELAYDGEFQLQKNAADILIQLHGKDVMWQKERLLNLALSQLPDDCDAVAWLDADIIFQRQDWAVAAHDALQQYPLIQPFSSLLDLPQDVSLNAASNLSPQRQSLAWALHSQQLPAHYLHQRGTSLKYGLAPGQAWAARRETLEAQGFYDAFILGSGDKLMLMAALGAMESAVQAYAMNAAQAEHYRRWAELFFTRVAGNLGAISGQLIHLWHGDLAQRAYSERHTGFVDFAFNPFKDIRLADNGCWSWNSAKPEMHAYVRNYFTQRNEDGIATSLPQHSSPVTINTASSLRTQ